MKLLLQLLLQLLFEASTYLTSTRPNSCIKMQFLEQFATARAVADHKKPRPHGAGAVIKPTKPVKPIKPSTNRGAAC